MLGDFQKQNLGSTVVGNELTLSTDRSGSPKTVGEGQRGGPQQPWCHLRVHGEMAS
jgi:hypothetical protein